MILGRSLPVALRAGSVAGICRGNVVGESKPPFLRILGSGSNLSGFARGAFCLSSSSGELSVLPPPDAAGDARKAVQPAANLATKTELFPDSILDMIQQRLKGTINNSKTPLLDFKAHFSGTKVMALPLYCYPLLPSNNIFTVKDPIFLASLSKSRKNGVFYAGAFLLKGNSVLDQDVTSLKGNELLKYLHEVGSLVEIIHFQKHEVKLRVHCRIQISNMVEEDPLTVRVECLEEDASACDYDFFRTLFMISDNIDFKPYMDSLIFKFKLLSDMDFHEASNYRDIIAAQMVKADLSYFGACADELVSIMNLSKWRKQKLLEELNVLQRIAIVNDLAEEHIEYKHFEAALSTLDFDFDELLMYYEEKVSSQPNILSECRAIIPDILEMAKVRDEHLVLA